MIKQIFENRKYNQKDIIKANNDCNLTFRFICLDNFWHLEMNVRTKKEDKRKIFFLLMSFMANKMYVLINIMIYDKFFSFKI